MARSGAMKKMLHFPPPITADEVLSRVTEAVLVLDHSWRIIYANAEAARISNKAVTEFVGRIHWDEWPGAVGTALEHEFRRAMRTQTPVHFTHLYDYPPSNMWLEVRAYPSPDRLTVFYRDITAQRETAETLSATQAKLREQLDKFQRLFEMMPVCLAIATDPQCKVVRLNPEFARLLRISPSANASAYTANAERPYRWMRGSRVLDPEELPQQTCCRLGKTVMNVDLELVFDDGERRNLFGHSVPLYDDHGQVRGSVAAYVDVTQQRKAEEILRRSESVAAAGRIAAALAHEINNPLQSLLNLHYLLDSAGVAPDVKRSLTEAQQELARVSSLVRQTLELYRNVDGLLGQATPIALERMLRGVVDDFRRAASTKGVALRLDLGNAGALEVSGEMADVFCCIVRNAIEACAQGCSILIRAEAESHSIRVTIEDDGPGIARDIQDHIFEPLFTTKKGAGLGLGLWVARRLVDRCGGSLTFHSRTDAPPQTLFTVVLPITAA